jgi:hypothetical protein
MTVQGLHVSGIVELHESPRQLLLLCWPALVPLHAIMVRASVLAASAAGVCQACMDPRFKKKSWCVAQQLTKATKAALAYVLD